MGNRFIARQEARLTGHHGRVSEKRVAGSLGARLTPNSGAMAGAKSDSRVRGTTNYQIESKSTTGKTISIEHEWLAKITREALATAAVPVLTVSFVAPTGKGLPVGDWVMIPLHHFQDLSSGD